MLKKIQKKIDLLLSGCAFSTEIFKRAFWYNGEILKKNYLEKNKMLHFDIKG